MIIYVDVLFVYNIMINCIILYATGLIIKNRVNFIKIFFGGLIGAIYVVYEYIFKFNICSNFFLKLILSLIMIIVVFNPHNLKVMFKLLLIFYLTTFTFGGLATYLIYVLKPQGLVVKNGIYVGSYVMKVILIGAIIGTILLYGSFKFVKNKVTRKDIIKKIKIKFNSKYIVINAMVDTGNMLKEPITGNPVIIVEKKLLYEVVSKEILDNIENILGGDFKNIQEDIKNEYISKIKMIPFSSLGKQNGMLIGIKADEIEIMEECSNKLNNVIVGIYNKSFSKKGEYNALIGIDLY